MEIDPKLLEKIQQALHQTLMTMVRSVVAIGATPQTVISMIRERLDYIESMVKEEARAATTDVPVPGVGDIGEPAGEAPVVAEASADQQSAGVRRVRGGFPTHGPTTSPWPRAETHGEWTDEDTRQYGIEPRTGPGLDPNHPF